MNQNELAAIHLSNVPMKDSFDKSSFTDAFFVNKVLGERMREREKELKAISKLLEFLTSSASCYGNYLIVRALHN